MKESFNVFVDNDNIILFDAWNQHIIWAYIIIFLKEKDTSD